MVSYKVSIYISFKIYFFRFISVKFVRYASYTKMRRKFEIFNISFNFFPTNKQIIVKIIIIQTQTKFCLCFGLLKSGAEVSNLLLSNLLISDFHLSRSLFLAKSVVWMPFSVFKLFCFYYDYMVPESNSFIYC